MAALDWQQKYRHLLGDDADRITATAERVRRGELTADELEAIAETWPPPSGRWYQWRHGVDGALVDVPESLSERMQCVYPEGDARRDWIARQMQVWEARRQR